MVCIFSAYSNSCPPDVFAAHEHTNLDPTKQVDWDDLPLTWRESLMSVLKLMSKEFNKEFAAEDVGTLEIAEEEPIEDPAEEPLEESIVDPIE